MSTPESIPLDAVVSFSVIAVMLGIDPPVLISELYQSQLNPEVDAPNVPVSGALRFSNFRGMSIQAVQVLSGILQGSGTDLKYTVVGQTARTASISMGTANHSAVIKDGAVWVWGLNNYGQLGNGISTTLQSDPASISSNGSLAGKTIVAIGMSSDHTIALDSTGGVHSWGRIARGVIGNGTTGGTQFAAPSLTSSYGTLVGKTITAIACYHDYNLALDNTGGVHAWGTNNNGCLGDGTTAVRSTPISIASSGSLAGVTVVAIACGQAFSVALDSTGSIHSWGLNNYGQLGDGLTAVRTIPYSIGSPGSLAGKTVVAIELGQSHVLALDNTGGVHAWGNGGGYQLGNNTYFSSGVPLSINSFGSLAGKTIVAIACGNNHNLVLDSTGGVHGWGGNSSGQLGDNSTTARKVPVSTSSYGSLVGKTVVSIASGQTHSIAVDSDGVFHSWGAGFHGRLGTGTTAQSKVPVSIGTLA